LIPNQRFLMWEIVILNLLETSDLIVKQKLFRLICNVFEFRKRNIFLEYKELFLKEIENQIESQNELELLANLDAIISIIEKKLNHVISKEKEIETVPNDQLTIKTDREKKNATEVENEVKVENEAEIGNAKELENQTEAKNEAKIETERIQENNGNPLPDSNLILFKSKDATISNDDKNTETPSNNSEDETPNNNEEVIDKKEPSFEIKEKEQEILGTDISELYLDNAGLVLIHPFLKSLFENCKLLNKDNTINNPEVAAHLLHYIATGKEQDYENAMIFEKFLCNIPIAEPIERNIVLSEEMKKEASTMLQAVLSNWEIMKTSSAELLQNEFLQRPGKLNINGDESPVITMERKTQDVLLDKLSWNLSIVKLAWKKRIIYVNW